MKTKNLLSRFSAAALVAAAALLPAALTSCSSEAEPNVPDQEESTSPSINLSFATPDMSIGRTRATDSASAGFIAADADEATITSLWLYIFEKPATGTTYTMKYAFDCIDRVASKNISSATDVNLGLEASNYSKNLPIAPGTYRFYMVANVDNYLESDDVTKFKPAATGTPTDALKTLGEADIKAMEMTLYNSGLKLENKKLPMGMTAPEICTVNGQTTTEVGGTGDITISTGTTNLLCDLTFLCSAVRYTFIYDKSTGGHSWYYDKFDVNSVKLNNIVDKYNWAWSTDPALSSPVTGQDVTLTDGKKCEMKKADNSAITVADFLSQPVALKETSAADWATATTHAYQGVVYLPVNYTLTNANKTTLTLNCDLSATDATLKGKTFDVALPTDKTANSADNRLEKGHFYDVVGKMTSTGMTFNVTVKKWKEGARQTIDF